MFGIGKSNKKKVLLVEDDALLVTVLEKQLKEEGYIAEKVGNGLEVITTAHKFKPNLILLDLVLPGLDGFEILRQLKEDDELSTVPVVVLSNLDKEGDVKSTIALGAKEHIVKVKTKLGDVIGAVKRNIKD
ncbi:MAG: Two component transcriptional regulator, winged helix family [Candidatus Magasanikbacteria bacterium GW2011_GWA2_37_8]|uniref:Two component transcriptional regulator, winged helix family n=1 Tax=Candidatus Magasanikbacteria bacterium GW2011_GWA2_37_8 TaxID=1619036 RepID=A0A0G0HBB0_9BACT|nr:MAG: Two component transcriptional regulator, winged helix family [Candidatus Magasanikbacteria bacterium GW2011_GWA2_37_8]